MMSLQNVTTEKSPVVSFRVPHKGTLSFYFLSVSIAMANCKIMIMRIWDHVFRQNKHFVPDIDERDTCIS